MKQNKFDLRANKLSELCSDSVNHDVKLSDQQKANCRLVVESKSACAIVVTLCLEKIVNPSQNITLHVAQLEGGFSGRTLDTEIVTPFMSKKDFPYCKETGWTTNAFRVPEPYDSKYPGKSRPRDLMPAFLSVVGESEKSVKIAIEYVYFIFQTLMENREKEKSLTLARPHGVHMSDIMQGVAYLWNQPSGAAKIPAIAINSVYLCLVKQVSRYEGKTLMALGAHHSADERSKMVGDINIKDGEEWFEAVEVKHNVFISKSLVSGVLKKIKGTGLKRYYILSTNETPEDGVDALLTKHKKLHGCEVIANGLTTTLKNYLRMLSDQDEFVDVFVAALQEDEDVKYDIKTKWDEFWNNK